MSLVEVTTQDVGCNRDNLPPVGCPAGSRGNSHRNPRSWTPVPWVPVGVPWVPVRVSWVPVGSYRNSRSHQKSHKKVNHCCLSTWCWLSTIGNIRHNENLEGTCITKNAVFFSSRRRFSNYNTLLQCWIVRGGGFVIYVRVGDGKKELQQYSLLQKCASTYVPGLIDDSMSMRHGSNIGQRAEWSGASSIYGIRDRCLPVNKGETPRAKRCPQRLVVGSARSAEEA